MWLFKKKVNEIEDHNSIPRSYTETSKRTVTISINHNIEYKYSYGDYVKFVDGKEAMSASGFTFEEFIADVLHHYPLNSVNQFYLVS